MSEKPIAEMSFEEAMAELEAVVNALEGSKPRWKIPSKCRSAVQN